LFNINFTKSLSEIPQLCFNSPNQQINQQKQQNHSHSTRSISMFEINWNTIPFVSQVISAVQAAHGDNESALKTQVEFAEHIDAIPVLSQIKSAVLAGCGDMKAASQVQDKFSKECLGVAQIRSAVEAGCGDNEAARKTQKEFLAGSGPKQIGVVGGALAGPPVAMAMITGLGKNV
jgi:hypothetical protein